MPWEVSTSSLLDSRFQMLRACPASRIKPVSTCQNFSCEAKTRAHHLHVFSQHVNIKIFHIKFYILYYYCWSFTSTSLPVRYFYCSHHVGPYCIFCLFCSVSIWEPHPWQIPKELRSSNTVTELKGPRRAEVPAISAFTFPYQSRSRQSWVLSSLPVFLALSYPQGHLKTGFTHL